MSSLRLAREKKKGSSSRQRFHLDEMVEVLVESRLELVLAEEEPLVPGVGRVRHVEEPSKDRSQILGLSCGRRQSTEVSILVS